MLLCTGNSLTQYQFKDALEVLNFNLTSGKEGITGVADYCTTVRHLNSPESPWRETGIFIVQEKVYFIYC